MASALLQTHPYHDQGAPSLYVWESVTNPKTQSALAPARFNLGYVGAISALIALTNPANAATTRIEQPHLIESSALRVHKSHVLPTQFLEAQNEMASFGSLPPGWDGPGSVTPVRTAIGDALAFLRLLPASAPSPEATASADGSVGWYWRTPKAAISITFRSASKMAYYGEHRDFDAARGVVDFDRHSIPGDLFDVIRFA